LLNHTASIKHFAAADARWEHEEKKNSDLADTWEIRARSAEKNCNAELAKQARERGSQYCAAAIQYSDMLAQHRESGTVLKKTLEQLRSVYKKIESRP
jgi:phage shock protein A